MGKWFLASADSAERNALPIAERVKSAVLAGSSPMVTTHDAAELDRIVAQISVEDFADVVREIRNRMEAIALQLQNAAPEMDALERGRLETKSFCLCLLLACMGQRKQNTAITA